MKVINNDRGMVAIISSIVVLGIVVGMSMNVFNSTTLFNKIKFEEAKDAHLEVVKDKLTKMAGFLVSQNIILCKQSEWGGQPGETCKWNNFPVSGSKPYLPEDFYLTNKGLDSSNHLVFDLNVNQVLKLSSASSESIQGELSKLKFYLKSSKDLGVDAVGELDNSGDSEFLVVVEGELKYKFLGKNKTQKFISAYRRPVPITIVTSHGNATCSQRCDVSLTQNPNRQCRSISYLDKDTATQVQMVTKNLGPGVLYDIEYDKKVSINNNFSQSTSIEESNQVQIPVGNMLLPRETRTWGDVVSCNFTEKTITKTQFVNLGPTIDSSNRNIVSDWANSIYKNVFGLIMEEAHAQSASSSNVTSNHVDDAGNSTYTAKNMEPKRKVSKSGGKAKLSGIAETTTVIIKVVRVH